ncbi:unnamed protein product [Rotaria sordida]|uniref:Uncharacterized protein n=1 Tax=Rotaria sordida TaxID=392033 RepID=A0A816BF92_9BILA|nr:unnamed protein product [Rotaria sordida]CAF1608428.1 unnamed protein product [Rotaria sordida]
MNGLRPLDEEDIEIWDMYKEALEKKIRDQFNLSENDTLTPIQVATQIVELSDKTYVTARVWHVPWQNDMHGNEDHVAVHEKLSEDPNEDLGHF